MDIVRPWKEVGKTLQKDSVAPYRDTQELLVGRELQSINKVDHPLVGATDENFTHEIATQAIRFLSIQQILF